MNKFKNLIKELCPNGVEYKKIEELCNISRGRVMSKDYIRTNVGEFPVYSSQTENNGELGKIATYDFDGEYLTWTTDGANAGSVFYRNGKFSVTNVCGLLEVTNELVNTKYLYYSLSAEAPKYVNAGMGNPKLMSNVMAKIKVAVPPLKLQNEIVNILDNYTKFTNELIEKRTVELNARKKQYEYYRNVLISNCEGVNSKLIDLLSQPITDGPHTTPQLFPTGVPFISATAVYDGKIHLEDAKGFISKEFDVECSKKYKPKKHDVYMVKSGSTTGKVAYVDTDEDFNIWSPLAAMRTNNVTTSRFLYHLLQTIDIQDQVQSRMSRGSQPNLSMRVLEQFDIKIPSIEEQKRIVDLLDKFEIVYNEMISSIVSEIEKRKKQYAYYMDELLSFKEVEINE